MLGGDPERADPEDVSEIPVAALSLAVPSLTNSPGCTPSTASRPFRRARRVPGHMKPKGAWGSSLDLLGQIQCIQAIDCACDQAGGGGSDILQGGAGDDTIDGGADDDLILAGDGQDDVRGGAGGDTIVGGAGDDTMVGDDGRDV